VRSLWRTAFRVSRVVLPRSRASILGLRLPPLLSPLSNATIPALLGQWPGGRFHASWGGGGFAALDPLEVQDPAPCSSVLRIAARSRPARASKPLICERLTSVAPDDHGSAHEESATCNVTRTETRRCSLGSATRDRTSSGHTATLSGGQSGALQRTICRLACRYSRGT